MRKFEIFIANKFIRDQNSGQKTRPVIRISVIAVALSCAIMLLTSAIVRGFKNEISDKVIGFGAHIQINHFENKNGYEAVAIYRDKTIEEMEGKNNVKHLHAFITKTGILKNGDLFSTNVLKGVGEDFDWQFFQKHLQSGKLPKPGAKDEIVISVKTAKELNVEPGNDILLYFIQDPPRIRKLRVVGTYESGFGQFDELIAITDIDLLRKLNDWSEDEISGYELMVNDFSKLDETNEEIYATIPHNLNSATIIDTFPDIFNWLELQDVNFVIIAILMLLVAAINMISALVILIIERAGSIGVLKALGADNTSIRRIFIYKGSYLLLSGIFWGNLFGLGLSAIQQNFQLIKLPVESYYLSSVPIAFEIKDIMIINLVTTVLCITLMIIPSYLITRINLVKVLRFR